jgi:hypothetical protein
VLERQVADAKARGARLLAGGNRLAGPGNWFEPTVFAGVDHSMELMREESFGPIIGIQKVVDDAEAVRLMNDTEHGLTAGVYTRNEERARRLLSQVHAGSVYWNCCDRVSPRLPWSGIGHSGIGLTLSTYGIETFTRLKAWYCGVSDVRDAARRTHRSRISQEGGWAAGRPPAVQEPEEPRGSCRVEDLLSVQVAPRLRTVIIGGGIMGRSVGYHLSQLGETDGAARTGRLTSGTNSAGLVGQLRATSTTPIRYSPSSIRSSRPKRGSRPAGSSADRSRSRALPTA